MGSGKEGSPEQAWPDGALVLPMSCSGNRLLCISPAVPLVGEVNVVVEGQRAQIAVVPGGHALHGLTPRNLGRRFTAVAKAAGIKARLTAHSGRVGLASELQAPNVGYTYAGLLLEFEAQ